jgi:hypothetical protein
MLHLKYLCSDAFTGERLLAGHEALDNNLSFLKIIVCYTAKNIATQAEEPFYVDKDSSFFRFRQTVECFAIYFTLPFLS